MTSYLKYSWRLRDVFVIFIMRLLLIYLGGRFFIFAGERTSYLYLQLLDSLVLLTIIILFLYYKKEGITAFFKETSYSFPHLFMWGIGLGVLLLVVGNWSESMVRQYLLADLQVHPLIKYTLETKRASQFIAPLLIGGFLVPVAEEFFYRGLLLPPMAGKLGNTGAIILNGLIFALVHFEKFWFWEIFIVGVLLAGFYYYFKSLWPGIITHIILNSGRLILIYLAV